MRVALRSCRRSRDAGCRMQDAEYLPFTYMFARCRMPDRETPNVQHPTPNVKVLGETAVAWVKCEQQEGAHGNSGVRH